MHLIVSKILGFEPQSHQELKSHVPLKADCSLENLAHPWAGENWSLKIDVDDQNILKGTLES